jgi:hypothetical protein
MRHGLANPNPDRMEMDGIIADSPRTAFDCGVLNHGPQRIPPGGELPNFASGKSRGYGG